MSMANGLKVPLASANCRVSARQVRAFATKTDPVPRNEEATSKSKDLTELACVLREDSANLFSEQGMDLSVYSDAVDFRDPITRYTDIQGFVKNLAFLKAAFNPTYDMLDIRQVNETDLEARWTMGFDVVPIKNSPLGKWWQPRLEFTGTTIYGTSASTGLIERHIDTWDSIKNQTYFSTEAFADVLSQIFNLQRTPQLPGLDFKLLKRKKAYSIRQYEPFIAAEARMPAASSPAGPGVTPFRELARYLFGGNAAGSKMQMTTPVITSDDGLMQFVLPLSDAADAPSPLADSAVQVKTVEGGLFAAIRFPGVTDNATVTRQRDTLLALMAADGLQPGDGYLLLRFNDPAVKGPFRRNEILIPIESGFDLWQT